MLGTSWSMQGMEARAAPAMAVPDGEVMSVPESYPKTEFTAPAKTDDVPEVTILFLAPDKASFSTGATFTVDGGKTAQ